MPRFLVSGASAAIVLTLLAASGCVMPDQLKQIQKDVADVQLELRKIEKSQSDAEDKLDSLATTVQGGDDAVTRADFADTKVLIENNGRQLAIIDQQLRDSNARMDRMAQDLAAVKETNRVLSDQVALTGGVAVGAAAGGSAANSGDTQASGSSAIPVVVPVAGGAGAVPEPDALYSTAYADYSKGNYSLAIAGFEEYAQRYGDTPLADNALYWVGECHFSQGNFDEAVTAFDDMLDRHPDSDRAAAANLKKGLAYLENNAVAEAIVQLRYVLKKYPTSDEARIARDKLVSLGASVD